MEIAGQMALKHKKTTTYHDTSTLNILYFNVNPILGTQKPRLPGLVEAAQARNDVKPPRITCDLRSRNSARLEDRRRASTELKKRFTSAVYRAVLGVEKGHR